MDIPYRDAYYMHHESRTEGSGGFNPISMADIQAFCELVGVASAPQKVKYLRVIRQMDRAYLDYCHEQRANK